MKLWNFLFIAVMVAAIAVIAVNGLNYGIDFTGGTLIEVKYNKNMDKNVVEKALDTIAVKSDLATDIGYYETVLGVS